MWPQLKKRLPRKTSSPPNKCRQRTSHPVSPRNVNSKNFWSARSKKKPGSRKCLKNNVKLILTYPLSKHSKLFTHVSLRKRWAKKKIILIQLK